MRIGVVADTHSKALPPELIQDLKGVDLIIHAGDVVDGRALAELKKFAEVKGVCGNMDVESLRKALPARCILTCEGVRIGVVHGEGMKEGVLRHVQEAFASDKVDVVIFGHSHSPLNKRIGSVLYFNPGSPTDDVFAPYLSYGILEIADKQVKAHIIKVNGHG